MTLTQALSEGLLVTFVGLVIVFSVLIILMLVMMAMKAVFYKEDKPTNEVQETKTSAPPVQAVQTNADEGELIAVLTAAIASSLNTSTYNLKIKSYRRVDNASPSWNRAGLSEVIESRF